MNNSEKTKSFVRHLLSLLLICAMMCSSVFCARIVEAEEGNTFTAQGINVTKHSPDEIRAYVNSHPVSYENETFATAPSLTQPYSAGSLSNASLTSALNALNIARYISGIGEVTLDSTYNSQQQAASLINALNGDISHYPTQPSGMSDSLFNLGKEGCRTGNLACGYTSNSLARAIFEAWLEDSDQYNIDRLGHRRQALSPYLGKTGFGYVKNENDPNWYYYYTSMAALDTSGSGSGITGTLWPAQNMPVEYFKGSYAWSVSVARNQISSDSNVQVTMKNVATGNTLYFSKSSVPTDGYFNIADSVCLDSYSDYRRVIVWRPDPSIEYNEGDEYEITITGLSTTIKYHVCFFRLQEAKSYALLRDGGQLLFVNSYNDYTDGSRVSLVDVDNYRYATATVYRVDQLNASSASDIPWYNDRTMIRNVSVADGQTIKPISFAYWFKNCTNLTSFYGDGFDTSGVTTMASMFDGCSSLAYVDVSDFDTRNVTGMNQMFLDCSSLESLSLVSFRTPNVNDLSGMFQGCSKLIALDISYFNTSNVTSMQMMFYGLSSYKSLNVSGFDTSKVTLTYGMFANCTSLTSLNLTGFNTSKVTQMYSMFQNCSSLTSLDLSSFNTSKVTDMRSLFYQCDSLASVTLGTGFTKWRDSAYLPSGSWRNEAKNLLKTETELYNGYPGNASSWSGTWNKIVTVTSLQFTDSSVTVAKGASKNLSYTILPSNATIQDLTWSSSNTSVVTISNGRITGVNQGTATVTATTTDGSNQSATCTVTVTVPAESITMTESSVRIPVNGTRTLIYTIYPSNASNTDVVWSSSSSTYVSVDQNGVITGLKKGSATITVRLADNSSIKSTCTVTVYQPVTSISLDQSTMTLSIDETKKITATVSPSGASNKNINWTSSNTNVATVDTNGNVTGIAKGSATITATAADGSGVTATCGVTVVKPVTSITLSATSLTLNVGDTSTLAATVLPSDASNRSVTWTTSDSTVASVSSSGKVTAKKAGTATITVTAKDSSGVSATATVTVKQPVTYLTLNKNSLQLTINGSETLIATVSPDDATNKTLQWSSSDSTVASVSSSGKVTGKKAGTATITVRTTDDSNLSATCTVTVANPVTSLTLSEYSLTLNKNESYTLTATVLPENATNKTLQWSSSNTNIASVDQNGTVTALAEGQAMINVQTTDGSSLMATCMVNVEDPDKYFTVVLHGGEGMILVDGEEYENYTFRISKDYPYITTRVEVIADDEHRGFAGWYSSPDSNEKLYESLYYAYIQENMELYAHYLDCVIITYDLNGGYYNGYWEGDSTIYQEKVLLDGNDRAKKIYDNDVLHEGSYALTGWMDQDGNRIEYVYYNYRPTRDVTLTAQWGEAYVVTLVCDEHGYFAYDDGYVRQKQIKVLKGKTISSNYEPWPIDDYHYLFFGYYEDPEYTKPIDYLSSYKPTADVTLYARFDEAITITFDANGGYYFEDEAYTQASIIYVKGKKLKTPGYYPHGNGTLAFAGWSLDPNATEPISNLTAYTATENMTFYAVWKESYTVNLHAMEGSFSDGDKDKTFYVVKGQRISNSYGYISEPTKENAKLLHWYTSTEFNADTVYGSGVYFYSFVINSDLDLYAQYADTCILTFDANGGSYGYSNISSRTVMIGNYLNEMVTEPTRADMAFNGWYDDPSCTGDPITFTDYIVNEDKTFYAGWTDDVCKITYHANGGTYGITGSDTYVQYYKRNAFVTSNVYLNNFLRDGYQTTGFYMDEQCTVKAERNYGFRINEDIDYYVGWTDDLVTVTFDPNGGFFSNPNASTTITVVRGKKLSSYPYLNLHTTENKAFAGWQSDADGYVGYTSQDLVDYVPSESTTLRALWTDDYYRITLHGTDGVPITVDYLDQRQYEEFTVYLMKGQAIDYNLLTGISSYTTQYNMTGWFFDPACTQEADIYNWTYVPTSDMDLYAGHKPIVNYTIKYHPNGGHIVNYDGTTDITYSSVYSVETTYANLYKPNVAWADDTKAFLGFSLTRDGSIIPNDYVFDHDTTIYAIYTDNTYTITVDLNGGSYQGRSVYTYNVVRGERLQINVYPKGEGGIPLLGYNTKSDGTGTYVLYNDDYAAFVPTEDMTIYAIYEDRYHRVEFVIPDGTLRYDYSNPIYILHGRPLNLNSYDALSNQGLAFMGWYENADYSGDPVYGNVVIDEDKIFYARFSSLYTVHFDSDGGSYVADQYVSEGQKATRPQDPTKEGYEFLGWYLNDSLFDFDTIIDQSITLKAKWNKIIVVTTIELSEYETTIYEGRVYDIVVTRIEPEEAADWPLTYVSDDESIATVDSNGRIRGIKEGTTYIRISDKDQNVTVSFQVNVEKEPVVPSELQIVPDHVTIHVNEDYDGFEVYLDGKLDNGDVQWYSLNEAVFTVDDRGRIRGVGAGTARIIVMLEGDDGDALSETEAMDLYERFNEEAEDAEVNSNALMAYAEVTVLANPYELSFDSESATIVATESKYIIATLTPADPDMTIRYVSSNPAILTIGDDGKAKGVKAGTATMTAYLEEDPTVTATCSVRVLFTDVAEPSKYFFDSVYWAFDNGITTGTSSTKFSPNDGCTRGQVVTFLWRLMGSPEPTISNP
ncbi:MAG: Ig-like domain-containing protein, partial [Erysipelotrichaceae bacterium]|nr:Ig-like domain-containing protein [Erysipelotrichaceae bacterium]